MIIFAEGFASCNNCIPPRVVNEEIEAEGGWAA